MAEKIVRRIECSTGMHRVIIVRRQDMQFTYRRQERTGERWGPASIDAGLYDSADTAELEARQRVSWLRDLFH